MTRFLGHVDADCYYVSAERVRHHCLRGVPCGVLSNQGACVIAKSYELKAYGVTTAMPIWDAVPLCPDAVFVKRDFRWYEILSRKMLAIIRDVSPRVEFYSIDEMFFEADNWGIDEARALQQRIMQSVGVPVSIGIAKTKTLAKLASDLAKPFGCFTATTEEDQRRLIENVPITEVTGIARRSAIKLARHGITTCDQLAAAYPPAIRKLLTVKGEQLLLELRGEPCYPIGEKREANKALARGGTLGGASRDPAKVFGWAYRNTERLIEALDRHLQWAERLTLSISFREGGGVSRRATLPEATNDFHLLTTAATDLLDRCWPRSLHVAYMHVIADRLSPRAYRQRGLFVRRSDPRVAEVKKQLNDKIGRFALRTAETLPLIDQYSDSTNDYDICDVYGKTCF